MIKTLKNLLKQDKERYSVPRKVQDIIPIQRIWKDGIFQVGNRFSKTYKFSDIPIHQTHSYCYCDEHKPH